MKCGIIFGLCLGLAGFSWSQNAPEDIPSQRNLHMQQVAHVRVQHVEIRLDNLAQTYPEQADSLRQLSQTYVQLCAVLGNEKQYAPHQFYRVLLEQLTELSDRILEISDDKLRFRCVVLLNHLYYFAPQGGQWISLREASERVLENISDFQQGYAEPPWGDFYQQFEAK